MEHIEAFEKGKLLKEALKIVDKLAKNDLADVDGNITDKDFEREELTDLIIKARALTKNHWWSLT